MKRTKKNPTTPRTRPSPADPARPGRVVDKLKKLRDDQLQDVNGAKGWCWMNPCGCY